MLSLTDPIGLRNVALLMLLSVQVGIQPILMKWYAAQATNVSFRLLIIECLKLIIAISTLIHKKELAKEMLNWEFRVALKTTVTPALIYMVQNYLNNCAVVVLDGVTFNILNQTKIIWTALMVYLILHKVQSRPQVGALMLLCLGAVLMTSSSRKSAGHELADSLPATTTASVQALIAAVLSGFAGTVIQAALQKEKRNPYMVTVELSLFGVLSLAISNLFVSSSSEGIFASNVWQGWSIMTLFTMLVQALGGILVGFVIKYTGNVEKSFAVVIGLIITTIIECFVNHESFGAAQFLAVGAVTMSTYIYTKFPPRPAQQKKAKRRRSKPGDGSRISRPLHLAMNHHDRVKSRSNSPAVNQSPSAMKNRSSSERSFEA